MVILKVYYNGEKLVMITQFTYFIGTKSFSSSRIRTDEQIESNVRRIMNAAYHHPKYKSYINELHELNKGNIFFDVVMEWRQSLFSYLQSNMTLSDLKIKLSYAPIGSDELDENVLLMDIHSGKLAYTTKYTRLDWEPLIYIKSVKDWIKIIDRVK